MNGVPVFTTTTVFGFFAATASINRNSFAFSEESLAVFGTTLRPWSSTNTSASALPSAAAAASSMSPLVREMAKRKLSFELEGMLVESRVSVNLCQPTVGETLHDTIGTDDLDLPRDGTAHCRFLRPFSIYPPLLGETTTDILP